MITDLFATLTTPTITTANTYYSNDHIDLLPVSTTSANSSRTANTLVDLGEGQPLYATITVTTAFASGTNVDFRIVTGTATNGTGTTAPTGATVHYTTGTIATASLTAGASFQFVIPASPGSPTYNRYLYLAAVTTGTYSAGVARLDITVGQPDGKTFYKSGFTVASL